MKRLLDRMVLYLRKLTRTNHVQGRSLEASGSLNSTVLVLSSQNDGSDPNRNEENAFRLLDNSFSTSHGIDILPHDALLTDKFAQYGRILAFEGDVQSRLEKVIDLIRVQHEDMKNYFQTQTMEIRNDIESKFQRQQDEIGNRIAKTGEMIDKIKKKPNLSTEI